MNWAAAIHDMALNFKHSSPQDIIGAGAGGAAVDRGTPSLTYLYGVGDTAPPPGRPPEPV